MNQKTLTIVVCCYNSSKTVVNTIESIDVSVNKDVDVFLIDDGSTDNLHDVVAPYLRKYPNNIHYFRKENGNWGSCVNLAISKANSRFLSILDSDDTYYVNTLYNVLKILKTVKANTDLIFVNYEFYFNEDHKTKIVPMHVSRTRKPIKYISYKRLPLFHLLTIHSAIFSTEMLKTIDPLPSNVYYSDSLLIYQALLRAKSAGYIDRDFYLYKYSICPGEQSISIEKSLKNYHHFEVILEHELAQPLNTRDWKRMWISRRCITMQLYWLMQILAKDYSRTKQQKAHLLKGYIKKFDDMQLLNNCEGRLHTPLTLIMRRHPNFAIWLTKVAMVFYRTGFVKATDYAKGNRKKMKELGRAIRMKVLAAARRKKDKKD